VARQIYAVTDAYRNVVQAALTSDLDGSRRRVLSLADMCATTVGRHLQAEVVKGLAALDGEIDEGLEMSLSGELYESVPIHYRRYDASFRGGMNVIVIVSCLQVDPCCTCDIRSRRHMPQPSVSLMLSLLGVALSHGLLTESKIFLRLFLTSLIRPSRNDIPSAIAHPLYPSYLVELCEEWTRLAPEACATSFTRRAFAAITLEILVEHGPRQAWDMQISYSPRTTVPHTRFRMFPQLPSRFD
jgi:hypothetical protein